MYLVKHPVNLGHEVRLTSQRICHMLFRCIFIVLSYVRTVLGEKSVALFHPVDSGIDVKDGG